MTILGRRNRVLARSNDEVRTHQSFAEDADINRILGRYRTTGFVADVALGTPVYADFSDAASYMESLNKLNEAERLFAALPARVRARVENDPSKLIAFVEDPENADELVELGLKIPVAPEPVEPVLVKPGLPVVDSPPSVPPVVPAAPPEGD